MKKIFCPDGPVVRFFAKVGSLIVLSFCWLVCCLPVVTVGASTAAMFCVAFELKKDACDNVFKHFFKAFAAKFLRGTLCWLAMAVIAGVIYCIPHVAAIFGMQMVAMAAVGLTTAIGLLWYLVLSCIFSLVAYFETDLRKTIKNAMIVALHNRRQSIGTALLLAVPLLVFLIEPMILSYTCGLWLLVFPGVWAYITAKRFEPIFEEYVIRSKEKEEEKDETL